MKEIVFGKVIVLRNKWIEIFVSYIFFLDLKVKDFVIFIKFFLDVFYYYFDNFIILDDGWYLVVFDLDLFFLSEKYKDYFKVGVVVFYKVLINFVDVVFIKRYFNSIIVENEMKLEVFELYEGIFNFLIVDEYLDFCKKNNIVICGYIFVWY